MEGRIGDLFKRVGKSPVPRAVFMFERHRKQPLPAFLSCMLNLPLNFVQIIFAHSLAVSSSFLQEQKYFTIHLGLLDSSTTLIRVTLQLMTLPIVACSNLSVTALRPIMKVI